LLESPTTGPEDLLPILRVMERHSKRLGVLVDDLLTLAQLESVKSNLLLSEVDLSILFSRVVRDWKKKLDQRRLRLIVELPETLSPIRADEARLHEVLDNLLDNAVKYSHDNGEICLRAERCGDQLALSVIDGGVGISKEDLPRIFERFYRADKARSRELGGTGLGLSIVKHIIQLHGGRVEAQSQLGRGTSVRVLLPIGNGER
jgi:two-component system phosphate regulon sensor histidine kinase PhoR